MVLGELDKKKYRQGTPLFYSVTFFSFESALLRTLCGFFLPCITEHLDQLAFVSPLSPLCPCVCVCFLLAGAVFQRNWVGGGIETDQNRERGKGKHRVFLIGEPEGRGMEGRGG